MRNVNIFQELLSEKLLSSKYKKLNQYPKSIANDNYSSVFHELQYSKS